MATLKKGADMVYLCPFGKIGAVKVEIKPAELVKLDPLCSKCLKDLNPDLTFFFLARNFYLVYNKLLRETLNGPCIREVLSSLGYSDNLASSLSYLKENFSKGCPPEIGFFLGYPPKDVLGFMGKVGFVYVKTLGWRMYEPVNSSETLYLRYKKARLSSLVSRCSTYVTNSLQIWNRK
ncbi:MAG: DUF3793 family protein [Bacillota bacterium]